MNANAKIAKRIVNDIEDDIDGGWWTSGTRTTLIDAATMLLDSGASETVVDEALNKIVGAIREEYGE